VQLLTHPIPCYQRYGSAWLTCGLYNCSCCVIIPAVSLHLRNALGVGCCCLTGMPSWHDPVQSGFKSKSNMQATSWPVHNLPLLLLGLSWYCPTLYLRDMVQQGRMLNPAGFRAPRPRSISAVNDDVMALWQDAEAAFLYSHLHTKLCGFMLQLTCGISRPVSACSGPSWSRLGLHIPAQLPQPCCRRASDWVGGLGRV
jgi:hypothetical protein